jgi:hypothetical protein
MQSINKSDNSSSIFVSAIMAGEFNYGSVEQWVTAAIIFALYGIFYLFIAWVRPIIPGVTLTILKHQEDIKPVKETVKNTWECVGVIATLVATMSGAMLVGDIPGEGDDYPGSDALRTSFYCFAGLSTVQLIQVGVECVYHLTYTEPLNSAGVIRYLIQNHGAIGGPAISTIVGCLFFCVSVICHVLLQQGLPMGVFIGILVIVFASISMRGIKKAMDFSPKQGEDGAAGWEWVEREGDTAPKAKHKISGKQVDTLRKSARQAREWEETHKRKEEEEKNA